jgi:divalent metal cation (Fe/Co/Zn/Cd) transporter
MKNNYKLLNTALILAAITIIYNIAEGLISVYFGIEDESLSLFGFGFDSFVEVISGIGIFHLILRIKNNGNENRDEFEKTALLITGTGFFVLTAGITLTALYNFYINHKPETTVLGIIISVVSIITMSILIHYKLDIGKKLQSSALIADANCTKTCLYLSIVLLIASVGYELTGFGGIDSLGGLAIAWFAFKEGREAFEKAKTGKNCGCDDHCAS